MPPRPPNGRRLPSRALSPWRRRRFRTTRCSTVRVTAVSRPTRRRVFGPWRFGSIGVVYGDIGTSPLYALKESLIAASAGGALTREMVFGVVSLMLWALIVIVTLKYVLFILRMDNNGEGGTLTLMALVQRR